jgi:hypothetical protein
MDSTFSKSQVLEFGKTSTGMFGLSFSNVFDKQARGSVRESRGSDCELNDREDDLNLFGTRATPFVKIDEDSDDRKNSNSSGSGKK